MSTWILLLRGINVGGTGKMRMKELVRILQSLGLENVRTYIQSGNVVFDSSGKMPKGLTDRITAAIHDSKGFRPRAQVLSLEQLKKAAAANPFEEAEDDPKRVHLFFLSAVPKDPNIDALAEAKSPTERFHLAKRVFYLDAPDGIGRSKLAGKVERILGVPTTGRNWRTVTKLMDMAQ